MGKAIYGYCENKGKHELNVYSSEEHVIGKWIDGKPLYRNTFETDLKQFNFSHIPYDTIFVDEIITMFSSGHIFQNGRYFDETDYYGYDLDSSEKLLTIHVGSRWINSYTKSIVTICYTKTTD